VPIIALQALLIGHNLLKYISLSLIVMRPLWAH